MNRRDFFVSGMAACALPVVPWAGELLGEPPLVRHSGGLIEHLERFEVLPGGCPTYERFQEHLSKVA